MKIDSSSTLSLIIAKGFIMLCTMYSVAQGQIPSGSFLWLQADKGITVKGSIVTSWRDQSNSIVFSPADSGMLPELITNAIQTHPVIHFQGNKYLEGPPVFPVQHDYTITAVVTINDTGAYNNILSGDHHAFWLGQNTYPAVVHSDHFFTQAVSRVGIRPGPNIITVRYSENTQQAVMYVNGLFGDSLFVDSNLDSSLYIGSYQRGYFLQGDIAELILYTRECSESEREQIEQYLFTKYGLTRPPSLPLPDTTFTEIPRHLQFYARDTHDSAQVPIRGTIYRAGFDSVYCILSKNDIPIYRDSRPLLYSNGKASFAFTPSIHTEMSEYSFKIGVIFSHTDSILAEPDSIICGDAYIVSGQSNAIFGYWEAGDAFQSEFCRTLGLTASYNIRDSLWALSQADGWGHGASVGGWALRLQKDILENQRIPTCIINGALSGNIIEHFERDSSYPNDLRTGYGNLLFRVAKAHLLNSIKAIFWVHGELYTSVDDYFPEFRQIYNDWKKDYPGWKKIYIGQLRPSYCADFPISKLRDLQRTMEDSLSLAETFALAALPYQDGCHFQDSGWFAFGDMLYRLVAHDFYNSTDSTGIHSPHIYKAFYSTANRNELKLVFNPSGGGIAVTADTNVYGINASLKDYFYFDDSLTKVVDLTTNGDTLTMKLNDQSRAQRVTYLPEQNYNNSQIVYEGPWLTSVRGTGALIFYDFPIADSKDDTNIPQEYAALSLDIVPNPANNSTHLLFHLPEASYISISVFDILGKEVRTLFQGEDSDGSHEIMLNPINLPEGEYFCRLQTDGNTITKKIIIAK